MFGCVLRLDACQRQDHWKDIYVGLLGHKPPCHLQLTWTNDFLWVCFLLCQGSAWLMGFWEDQVGSCCRCVECLQYFPVNTQTLLLNTDTIWTNPRDPFQEHLWRTIFLCLQLCLWFCPNGLVFLYKTQENKGSQSWLYLQVVTIYKYTCHFSPVLLDTW